MVWCLNLFFAVLALSCHMKRGRAGQTTRETDRKCVFAVFSIHESRSSRSRDFQTHKSKLMCKLRLGACKGFSVGRWNVGGVRLQVMSQIFFGSKRPFGLNFIAKAVLSANLFMGDLFSHQTPAVRKLKHTRLRSALPFAGCSTSPKQGRTKQQTV